MVERMVRIHEVRGSIPLISTITRGDELTIIWFKFVFAIDIKTPRQV